MSLSTLQIERQKALIGCLADITVLVDGNKLGTVKNGKTARFKVESGEHTLTCKGRGAKDESISIVLTEDEVTRVELSVGSLGGICLTPC